MRVAVSGLLFFFFFFKQKTAYEMRISDWSSDVCSSDLPLVLLAVYLGGLWTAALVAAAGGAMGWEWARLCNGGHLGAAGIVSIVTLAALAPAFVDRKSVV